MSHLKSLSIKILTLVGLLLLANLVWGFTEPSSSPPGLNTPAPLNVSSSGQSKAGGLILNTGGASYGLIVDQGSVGIGTQSPTQKLDVIGYIRGATGLCIGSDCRMAWPSYIPTCPSGYADAGSYCIEQNERSPDSWWGATVACKNAGAELCPLTQWYPACTQGLTSNMTNNYEWMGDMAYHVSQYHAVFIGSGSCTAGSVTPPGAASFNFRCCVNK